jgi:hypothetical protein
MSLFIKMKIITTKMTGVTNHSEFTKIKSSPTRIKNSLSKRHFLGLWTFLFTLLLGFHHEAYGNFFCSRLFKSFQKDQKTMESTQPEKNEGEGSSTKTNKDGLPTSSLKTRTKSGISKQEISDHIAHQIGLVPEFQYMRETAHKMGLRVWLFGGTASSFLHYAKWDLAKNKGLMDLQKDRFDFDFTNIFRSTQDLDLVIDGTVDKAQEFERIMKEKFPHFLGSKTKWETRTLRYRRGVPTKIGFKEALLNDKDFEKQNTDSHSLGLVEITLSQDPMIRDLRHWNEPKGHSVFLEDALNNEITYFRSPEHFTTARAQAGENPEILSVLRLLVKAFQYELTFSEQSLIPMGEIIKTFNPSSVTNSVAQHKIEETAKKLIFHAVNLEYTINKLEELGLRQKLIQMGDPNEAHSFAWWINREPLRSKPVGLGRGKTAKALGIDIVAHETSDFLAYESITRAHSGEPNVLISREDTVGESAVFGKGFYTQLGRLGARNTGLTIRFTVDPLAREGSDFIIHREADTFIIFQNKKALKIIQESLNFTLDDFIHFAKTNKELLIDHSDGALLEKLKRRLNNTKIMAELDPLLKSSSETDLYRLTEILSSFQHHNALRFFSRDTMISIFKNIYDGMTPWWRHSSKESDILIYIKVVDSMLKILDSMGIPKTEEFLQHLKYLSQGPWSSDLRKEAIFQFILNSEIPFILNKTLLSEKLEMNLSTEEFNAILAEIKRWDQSSDVHKRNFFIQINTLWSQAIQDGNIKKIQELIDTGFFEINYKNISQVSLLQLAAYYKQDNIIDWLISNPEFDFQTKNAQGFNEIEQLRLSGRGDLANYIEQQRREAKGHPFHVKERNTHEKSVIYPEGTPIIDFVRIEPNSFVMNITGGPKFLTTISKPFEIMSVDVTHGLYKEIVKLIEQNLSENYYTDIMSRDTIPLKFKSNLIKKALEITRIIPPKFKYRIFEKTISLPIPPGFRDPIPMKRIALSILPDHPLQNVSYIEITSWLKGLNELSKLPYPEVQQALSHLLPGHKPGQIYSRGTMAQWGLVLRLGGAAEGDYASGHGDPPSHLNEYAAFKGHSHFIDDSTTSRVLIPSYPMGFAPKYVEKYFLGRLENYDHIYISLFPVGFKKPVFYNGKPLYDLHGLVSKYIEDPYLPSCAINTDLLNGIDPQYFRLLPNSTSPILHKVGNYNNRVYGPTNSHNFRRDDFDYNKREPFVGFRLIRTVER